MYCVVVRQRAIGIVCVLCGCVAACYLYGLCTVWWCGSVSQIWFVYCVVVWQRVMSMVRVLCGGVAAGLGIVFVLCVGVAACHMIGG